MTPERWAKVEEIYQDALDREESARSEFLQHACLGDEELRREVESLLAEPSGSFLKHAVVTRTSGGNGPPVGLSSLIGMELGLYKVTAKLGEGGMGVVYRAKDSKLGRDVAIKVLPPELVDDPERLARFRREAKLLASLNHPNIATIHGMEDSGDTHFLVMELVEGKTLAERVHGRPLPLKEALGIGRQIAEALEHAHQRKVIHRDLKPANVVLTSEGRVKVLDFGLAKAFSDEDAELSESHTLSMMPTDAGRIMGTPAYMSPEQAQGKQVDKQSDIWAFGCLLFELLTARRAFSGENTTQIIAAVLHNEPDWKSLPSETSAAVRNLLRRCLQKDPARRLHSAADLAIDIGDSVIAADIPQPNAATPMHSSGGIIRQVWPAVAVGVVLIATLLLVWRLKPPRATAALPVERYVIPLTEQERVDPEFGVAIAPDGEHIAILAKSGGVRRIYVRTLQDSNTRALVGTEGAVSNPFFSPDSKWLGFFTNGKLKKVSIDGGAPVELSNVNGPRGGRWGDNGMIAFTPYARGNGVFEINADGGEAKPITKLDTAHGETSHRMPFLLPGGKAVLFAAYGFKYAEVNIVAQSLQTGERKTLIEGATQPLYVPTGHLLYVQPGVPGTLMAVPFDPVQLKVLGPPVPVVNDVLTYGYFANWTVSNQGKLVYVPGGAQSNDNNLTWVDRKGISQPIPMDPRPYTFPRLSPDGKRILYALSDESDLWVYDLATKRTSRFTFAGSNSWPIWTPDGKHIIYSSNRLEPWDMFWKSADGDSGESLLLKRPGVFATSVSPDGKLLTFFTAGSTSQTDIWVMDLNQPEHAKPWLQTPAAEVDAKFSPDGKWMAYASNESGRFEIYVRPFPGPGEEREISLDGGTESVWSHNGRELFFRNGEKMMAADIHTSNGFQAGTPHALFSGPFQLSNINTTYYDVTSDGQRFLMIKPAADKAAPSQLNVVVNWFEELKQKVPTGK